MGRQSGQPHRSVFVAVKVAAREALSSQGQGEGPASLSEVLGRSGGLHASRVAWIRSSKV
jgi:hypothetical protein